MRVSSCSFLLVLAGCNWGQPEYVEPTFSAAPADALPPTCAIGSVDPGAREVPMAHVLREPGAWVEKKVRIRGHILMIHEQGYFLYADGLRLPIQFDQGDAFTLAALAVRPTESTACGTEPVDVEGTIAIAPDSVALKVWSVRTIPDERDRSKP